MLFDNLAHAMIVEHLLKGHDLSKEPNNFGKAEFIKTNHEEPINIGKYHEKCNLTKIERISNVSSKLVMSQTSYHDIFLRFSYKTLYTFDEFKNTFKLSKSLKKLIEKYKKGTIEPFN